MSKRKRIDPNAPEEIQQRMKEIIAAIDECDMYFNIALDWGDEEMMALAKKYKHQHELDWRNLKRGITDKHKPNSVESWDSLMLEFVGGCAV